MVAKPPVYAFSSGTVQAQTGISPEVGASLNTGI